jgi:hypothetical protein
MLAVADITHTVTYFNGDDALGLFNGATMIDAIGIYQQDPGTAWDVAGTVGATLNHTLIRKPNITSGNPNWTVSAGTNMDDSEWVVHPQDYVTDLGMHTFNPGGGEQAGTPSFNPPAGVYNGPINVVLTSSTPGASIYYTTNGSNPTNQSTLYTAPIPLSSNTTLKAIAYASSMDPSYVATAEYLFPLLVSNIAQLRAQEADNSTIYRLSNQVVMTFAQSWRHQKYIQDHTAAILIDDYNGVITTNYQPMDGIVGITGKLYRYTTNMLQFVPVADPGPASQHNAPLSIPVVTVSEINNNHEQHQSKVRINECIIWLYRCLCLRQNYNLTDSSGTIVFRTAFFDVDYVVDAMAIPTGQMDIKVIVNQFNTTPQVTSRSSADFNPPVSNDDDVIVAAGTQLLANYPNPFNPETTIRFSLENDAEVMVNIYNTRGQLVRSLVHGQKAAGMHSVVWNGMDDNGQSVSSGIYYYKMYAGKYSSTRKMILMK